MQNQTTETGQFFIRYEPKRTDYTLTEDELQRLRTSCQNNWKDFCLVFLPTGIACLINAIPDYQVSPFKLTISLFLNSIFASIGIIGGIIFAHLWILSDKSLTELIKKIESKPIMRVRHLSTDTGDLQSVVLEKHTTEG